MFLEVSSGTQCFPHEMVTKGLLSLSSVGFCFVPQTQLWFIGLPSQVGATILTFPNV